MLGQDDQGGIDHNEIQDMIQEQGKHVHDHVRLVYRDGVSNKFYDISIVEQGGVFDVPFQFGRVGTDGQSGYKVQGVAMEDARKGFDKAVREKMRKGYVPYGKV